MSCEGGGFGGMAQESQAACVRVWARSRGAEETSLSAIGVALGVWGRADSCSYILL